MQINKLSSAAMAAAAAMLFTSAIGHRIVRGGRSHRALHGREFLQGHVRVQVGEEQLQGHEQLQGPGLDVHVEGRLRSRAKAKAAAK